MNRSFLCISIIAAAIVSCKSNTPKTVALVKNHDSVVVAKHQPATQSTDSTDLTKLMRELYKWHETHKMEHAGFKPVKSNATDTLYTGIDLDENAKTIEELKQTGFFTQDFLNDYRNIAVRMDKELRDGSSLWPDGELPTFDSDADEWCNCQDFPVDDYWNIIKLTGIKISGNEAAFNWTWGNNFRYKVRAKKEDGSWKIAYLQGFDMAAYSWEWQKKNK